MTAALLNAESNGEPERPALPRQGVLAASAWRASAGVSVGAELAWAAVRMTGPASDDGTVLGRPIGYALVTDRLGNGPRRL